MNPYLQQLQTYPFEKLRQLFSDVTPNPAFSAISLGIGEPRHPTPPFIRHALADSLDGLAAYPSTVGMPALRTAISGWLARRYGIPAPSPETQILPVLGSREALFAIAQTVIDISAVSKGTSAPLIVCPNPFYQIYEGAAILSGAQPYFVNADPARNFNPDYQAVPDDVWQRTQLLFVCSPGNPTGAVIGLEEWRTLFELSDRYGFVIASDECYSEIHPAGKPPLGGLQAAYQLGRTDYRKLIVFSSLSKRSNVPGMRSGFVAGDAQLMKSFLLYRTYQGGAMSPSIQLASIAAWNDEAHVEENRRLYAEKFDQLTPMLAKELDVRPPDASFYLWANVAQTGLTDLEFARQLYEQYHVTVLPGRYLARDAHGINPGEQRIRMALVASPKECLEAVERVIAFVRGLRP